MSEIRTSQYYKKNTFPFTFFMFTPFLSYKHPIIKKLI